MKFACWLFLVVLVRVAPAQADPIVIDFESLNTGDSVTNQFAGLTFSNATVVTAGITLDESEFPPHSGVNAVFDDGGPITIDFAAPVLSFGGYFTYSTTLTLAAFDAADNLIASATSDFMNNMALSGVAGSAPNEFIETASASGISSVTISGDAAGGSFVLDDATITSLPTVSGQVPEASAIVPLLAALTALAGLARRRPRFAHIKGRLR